MENEVVFAAPTLIQGDPPERLTFDNSPAVTSDDVFRLTDPIVLGTIPADRVEVTTKATGDLTLRGTTRQVVFDRTSTARRNGGAVEVQGAIPIVFADLGIPDASFGPATVQDHGEVEFVWAFALMPER